MRKAPKDRTADRGGGKDVAAGTEAGSAGALCPPSTLPPSSHSFTLSLNYFLVGLSSLPCRWRNQVS